MRLLESTLHMRSAPHRPQRTLPSQKRLRVKHLSLSLSIAPNFFFFFWGGFFWVVVREVLGFKRGETERSGARNKNWRQCKRSAERRGDLWRGEVGPTRHNNNNNGPCFFSFLPTLPYISVFHGKITEIALIVQLILSLFGAKLVNA